MIVNYILWISATVSKIYCSFYQSRREITRPRSRARFSYPPNFMIDSASSSWEPVSWLGETILVDGSARCGLFRNSPQSNLHRLDKCIDVPISPWLTCLEARSLRRQSGVYFDQSTKFWTLFPRVSLTSRNNLTPAKTFGYSFVSALLVQSLKQIVLFPALQNGYVWNLFGG